MADGVGWMCTHTEACMSMSMRHVRREVVRMNEISRVGCEGGIVVAEATLCSVGMVKSLPVKQSFGQSK